MIGLRFGVACSSSFLKSFQEIFDPILLLEQFKHIVLAFIAQICSYARPTAIHHNIGAGNIRRFIACKKQYRITDLISFASTP